jgi:uncharacterized ferritin-like protein (DUF455 family)
MTCCPEAKVRAVRNLAQAWRQGRPRPVEESAPLPIGLPGRPDRPTLVAPTKLSRRRLGSIQGRAALIHAIAHIEFNAINLALDAVYRFRGLPDEFYGDWLKVAFEEATHFSLLDGRLRELGFGYGDFPAHDGLWQMAVDTADDVLLRMALVPRVLEARGLDVTPGMIQRLEAAGDGATADILGVILQDEIGHVAIGSRWFRSICAQRGLAPEETFQRMLETHLPGGLKGPLNIDARLQAGFSPGELEKLAAQPGPRSPGP